MADVFKPCAVSGCKLNAHHASRGRGGWCNKHYLRWKRSGKPEGLRTDNGEPLRYLLAHMWDDCPKWPFYSHSCGYGEVHYKGRKGQRVHRIVCELVNGPPPTRKHQAAHNCGKGREGCFGAKCLEWKLPVENAADAQRHGTWAHGESCPSAKLTEDQVVQIKRLKPIGRPKGQLTAVALKFGVSRQTIHDIWAGKTWGWMERDTGRV